MSDRIKDNDPPKRRMASANMWPSWANNTYRDPTAQQRSHTRQLEKRIENTDLEKVPGVGPFVGAGREVQELMAGKEPDAVTLARGARVAVAMTPVGKFPGSTPVQQFASKTVTSVGAGVGVNVVQKRAEKANNNG